MMQCVAGRCRFQSEMNRKQLRGAAKLFGSVLVLALMAPAAPEGCRPQRSSVAMSYPPDLLIHGLAGGVHPWEENYSLRVTAQGRGHYTRFVADQIGAPPLAEVEFAVTVEQLSGLWAEVEEIRFFDLDEKYRDETAQGGVFASITVTGNGATHRVEVQNASVPEIEQLIDRLNRISPPGHDLVYAQSTGP
jgi:hypothetical protein